MEILVKPDSKTTKEDEKDIQIYAYEGKPECGGTYY